MNGGLNLSVSDGWWCEGDDGENGWTIGPVVTCEFLGAEQGDYDDAALLYALLEENVVPLYFDREAGDIPRNWLARMRRSLRTLTARFSSCRMVRDYLEGYYLPAARRDQELRADKDALARRLAAWKRDVTGRFNSLKMGEIRIEGLEKDELIGTRPMRVDVSITPGAMKPEELLVQLVAGPGNGQAFTDSPDVVELTRKDGEGSGPLHLRLFLQPHPQRAAHVRRPGHAGYGRAGLAAGDAPRVVG